MTHPQHRSAEHWRRMAEEARTMADGLATEANRQLMLSVAADYDGLAALAEREEAREARASSRGASSPHRRAS